MKHVLYCVVGLLLITFFVGIKQVSAATTISSSVTSDNTWTASSSPYIIAEALTIASGATLTLEPGVVVKLQTKGVVVNGTLRVMGTENQKVYITSQSDDIVGGDSNNNGSASTPAPGAWQGIQVNAGGAVELTHTVVRYAGATVAAIRIPKISSIHNSGGTVSIVDSEFSHSSTCAVGQSAGSVSTVRMNAHDLTCGVIALGGSVSLLESIIKNTDTGLFVNGATSLELTSNAFEQNVHTADINLGPITSFVHHNNTAVGSPRAGLLLRGSLSRNVTLTKDTIPYLLTGEGGSRGAGGFTLITDGNLTVASGATLTLEPGVAMKFESTARLIVSGALEAQGTQTEKVYFTSAKDDSVFGDNNNDGGSTLPAKADWVHIQLGQGSRGSFTHSVVRYGGRSTSNSSLANIYNNGGTLSVSESEISFGSAYGVRHHAGTTTVTQSLIHQNTQYGVLNSSQKNVDARNNYWGHTMGPRHATNPSGAGDTVSDRVLFDPWKTVHCTENCNSSVFFLPGIMGSNLYEQSDACFGFSTERQRWFSVTDCSQLRLQLDETGHSMNDIYTKSTDGGVAAIAEVNTDLGKIPTQKLYADFFERMNALESSGQIAEFKPFAYDWRLRLDELLYTTKNAEGQARYTTGISYKDGLMYTTLSKMATDSKNGKVTLVAHSNGGLLAKTFLKKLADENDPLLAKIDNLVLVAVPQVGTPDAVTGVLHGIEILGGHVVTQQTARTIFNNSPFGYHLLPNEHYFSGSGSSVATPAIVIDSGTSTDALRAQFGASLSTFAELKHFLGSGSGRTKPEVDDLQTPEVANDTLLTYAEQTADSLASWAPPASMSVHQLGGVGIWTPKTLRYYTGSDCVKTTIAQSSCVRYNPKLAYDVYHTQDGDGTVVLPSSLSMSDAGNVKRWWVDLDAIARLTRSAFVHKNIMEIGDIADFITNVAKGEPSATTFITGTESTFKNEHQLVYELHSPLDMYIESREGRVSSTTEEVPGSFYHRYGEVQYVGVPADTKDVTLHLNAYDSGSFTLFEEVWDETGSEVTGEYTAIPTATTSVFILPSGTTTLSVDFDGNGEEDGKVFEEQDVISVLKLQVEPETEEEEEVVIEAEKIASVSKQGSRSRKDVPVPQVAGASTNTDIVRLKQMVYLLQEIIRLTLLLRQQI